MSSFKGKTVALAAVLVIVGIVGGEAFAAAPKKSPLCAMGKTTTRATPCKANPAFGKDGCKVFEPSVTGLVGSPATAGANRGGGDSLGCFFIVNGERQAFQISVSNTPKAQSYLDQTFAGYVQESVGLHCPNAPQGVMVSPPQLLSGLGDKAFVWDQCTPRGVGDSTYVQAVKGHFFYAVLGSHPNTNLSVDQLVAVVRQLMVTYH